MPITIPNFTTSAVINGNTLISQADEQLNILMTDVENYVESTYQTVATNLEGTVGIHVTTASNFATQAEDSATNAATSANPAFPLVPGAVGAGCSMKWLPMFNKDYLYIIRGGGTNNIYVYNLSTNTMTSETYFPNTETFSTGSTVATRSLGGVTSTFLIQRDVSMRVLEYNPGTQRMLPKLNQWLYPTGTAVVGDRGNCLTSPSGIEFYYLLLSSSTGFVRCALIDS